MEPNAPTSTDCYLIIQAPSFPKPWRWRLLYKCCSKTSIHIFASKSQFISLPQNLNSYLCLKKLHTLTRLEWETQKHQPLVTSTMVSQVKLAPQVSVTGKVHSSGRRWNLPQAPDETLNCCSQHIRALLLPINRLHFYQCQPHFLLPVVIIGLRERNAKSSFSDQYHFQFPITMHQ